MDEFRDLDQMLEEFAIPEEALEAVSPWKPAMGKILWGLALNAITFSIWNLEIILPTLGVALMWLGWRSLRRENRWFRAGWLGAGALLALRWTALILRATPLMGRLEPVGQVFVLGNLILLPLLALCLWRGLKGVFRKAEQPPKTGAAFGLLAWYLGVAAAALIYPQAGTLFALFMLLVYFILIYLLWQVAQSLSEAGYVLEPVPVKRSDRWVMLLLALALAVGIGGGLLAFQRFPDGEERKVYTVREEQQPAALREINARLLELGYPEELLADLSVEDRYRCRTAVGLDTTNGDFPYNSHTWNSPGLLKLRTVSVVLADGTCRFFNHFQWKEEPRYRGMESFEVVPTFHDLGGRWGDVSGRFLYEKNRGLYETDFYRLEARTGPTTCRWGDALYGIIKAEFSLPKDGYSPRGYIAYTLEGRKGLWQNFNAGVAYNRMLNPWSYPWASPADRRELWGTSDDWSFRSCNYWNLFSLYNPNMDAWAAIVPQDTD